MMEWSKEKTLKLIELLQVNPSLWNPTLCDNRRDKQKRKEELRAIADVLGISIADTTKKIQHLRTQYNRESARQARVNADDPDDTYISNWYAYEFLHFMKDSSKPYSFVLTDEHPDNNGTTLTNLDKSLECKQPNLSPSHKVPRTDSIQCMKSDVPYPTRRDEFSVFGEYIANELRSLKGEKNLLIAKKKIQDAIFEVKMGMISDARPEQYTVYTHANQTHIARSLHNGKLYSAPALDTTAHIEPLPASHTPPTSQINEIIINNPCHYTNFKVDSQ